MTTEEMIGLGLALLLMLLGLIGSIAPGLPGTPLILLAAIGHRLYFGATGVSNLVLGVLAGLTIVSIVFDFLASVLGAKKFGATWRGALGAVIGGVVGIFFSLPGIIFGPFLGAMLFELLGGQEYQQAAKAGAGAMLGLVLGIVAKFSIGVVMMILFAVNVVMRSVNG
jgi:uncharacterized protein YqgC (DUF456 family)